MTETVLAPPRYADVASVGVGTAVRRHPFIVIVTTLILVGAGAAYGLVRKPIYTATSRLAVGTVDLSSPGALSGFAVAAPALASSYSRVIGADAVVGPVALATHVSNSTVRSDLSATPIPQSPVFSVSAASIDQGLAINMANAGSTALLTYVSDLNRRNPDTARLFKAYQFADRRFQVNQSTLRDAIAAFDSARHPSAGQTEAVIVARTNVDIASMRASAVRSTYAQSLSGQSTTQLVQQLSSATTATDDKLQKLEIGLFVGLVIGLILGTALATLRARPRDV